MGYLIGVIFLYVIGIFNGIVLTWKTFDSSEVTKIAQRCENNQGLDRVVVKVANSSIIYCKDGAEFKL